jgi:hypothetical protein
MLAGKMVDGIWWMVDGSREAGGNLKIIFSRKNLNN